MWSWSWGFSSLTWRRLCSNFVLLPVGIEINFSFNFALVYTIAEVSTVYGCSRECGERGEGESTRCWVGTPDCRGRGFSWCVYKGRCVDRGVKQPSGCSLSESGRVARDRAVEQASAWFFKRLEAEEAGNPRSSHVLRSGTGVHSGFERCLRGLPDVRVSLSRDLHFSIGLPPQDVVRRPALRHISADSTSS